MIIEHTFVKLGTIVICPMGAGYGFKVGQVASHVCGQYSDYHLVVKPDGSFDQASHIGEADQRGIGWKIATAREIERANRQTEWEKAS